MTLYFSPKRRSMCANEKLHTMVKLKIYDSGNRPELPKDPSTAAHWVIGSMEEPDDAKAHIGTWANGVAYAKEWTGSSWHIECKPIQDYIRYALGKAISHKTPRVDIDLPINLEKEIFLKLSTFREGVVMNLLAVLNDAPQTLEVSLIIAVPRMPGGLLNRLERDYQHLVGD